MKRVHSLSELQLAIEKNEKDIRIEGTISNIGVMILGDGQCLSGGCLEFKSKGLGLTSNNTLKNITIVCPPVEQAIWNHPQIEDFGTLSMNHVKTYGQVNIIAAQGFNMGTLVAEDVHVIEADVRGREQRPFKYAVETLQGGFNIWNQCPENTELTVRLTNIAIGTPATPVRGSGIFVSGYSESSNVGGVVKGKEVSTKGIFTDGGISPATPNLISGGVFICYGSFFEKVVNKERVVTFGPNDMVLDLWGDVKNWHVLDQLLSYGPSAIGFVNFGNIDKLKIDAEIITRGDGSRGFNLYDGSLQELEIHSITTHGDGSVGLQISKPLNRITICEDVKTYGQSGSSLVKGVVVNLKAIAVSIKEGGIVEELNIGGSLISMGDDTPTLEVNGEIKSINVGEEIVAFGKGSNAVSIAKNATFEASNINRRERHPR
ncbi:hypothetical protein [Microbulbifer sp. TYP-18]|uniref:hypothetical protein n=1 Tax=Microbulbifer sp. TYP-18 TaxID=3230024 RepID=UPI0034C6C77F